MTATTGGIARSLASRLHVLCDDHIDSTREEILRDVRRLALTVNKPADGELFGLNSGDSPLDRDVPAAYCDEPVNAAEMILEINSAIGLADRGDMDALTAHLRTLLFTVQARALHAIAGPVK